MAITAVAFNVMPDYKTKLINRILENGFKKLHKIDKRRKTALNEALKISVQTMMQIHIIAQTPVKST